MTITINRCNSLPVVREPNCIYFVKDAASEDIVVYVTGNDASIIRNTLTRSEVASLISDNGKGILTVASLPTPSVEYAGRIMCLAATNIPYWCNGTSWVDITAITSQAQYNSLQAQITDLLNTKQATAAKDKSSGYVGLTALKINFRNALDTITSFFTNTNTVARTYLFQDRNGTIADDTDLALKAPLASPQFSGNVSIGVIPKVSTSNVLQIQQYQGVQAGHYSSNLGYYNAGWRSPYTSTWVGYDILPTVNGVDFYVSPPNSGLPDDIVMPLKALSIDMNGNVQFPGILSIIGYTEKVYDLIGTVISAANGAIQTKTLTGVTILTETLVSGQSIVLGIDDGAAYNVTLPPISWMKPGGGGTAPTLNPTLKTWILIWKVGTTLYGAYLGDA